MDRFHNEYGSTTQEADEICKELSDAIKPIIERYAKDVEAIIFLREALSWLYVDVGEALLRYQFDLFKKDVKDGTAETTGN